MRRVALLYFDRAWCAESGCEELPLHLVVRDIVCTAVSPYRDLPRPEFYCAVPVAARIQAPVLERPPCSHEVEPHLRLKLPVGPFGRVSLELSVLVRCRRPLHKTRALALREELAEVLGAAVVHQLDALVYGVALQLDPPLARECLKPRPR